MSTYFNEGNYLSELLSVLQTSLPGEIKISVISDPHYFAPSLGTSGAAFDAYLMQDRKMIAESDAILQSAIDIVEEQHPDILLIPGDLTKDGEKVSHEAFAAYLADLESTGVKVYVIPGNHDVNNPHAMSYDGDSAVPVESVSPEDFQEIYADFGYGEALYRDPNSLSYVSAASEKLWILGIDSCEYVDNLTSGTSETSGSLSAETKAWVLEKLAEAKVQGITVIGMMHHNLVEHYSLQAELFPDYVVDDSENLAQELADAGLSMIFTGHYHANDIVQVTDSGLYEIETGSLVTWPSPVRTVTISEDGGVEITSTSVSEIDYDLGEFETFEAYASDFLNTGLVQLATYYLMGTFGVTEAVAASVAPLFADAMSAHYMGDEEPDATTLTIINAMIVSGDAMQMQLAGVLQSLWTDSIPTDNEAIIGFPDFWSDKTTADLNEILAGHYGLTPQQHYELYGEFMDINPNAPLLNATVDGPGNVVTLYFEGALDTESALSVTQFSIMNGETAQTIQSVQVVNNQVVLTLASILDTTQSVTVSYTAGADTLQGRDGEDAPSFTDFEVTTSLSQTPSESESFSLASSITMDHGAEISALDLASGRLFVTSPENGLQVLGIDDQLELTRLGTITLGSNDVNSVAVKNGIVAVAVANADKSLPGSVWFLDADGVIGDASMILGSVTVGALPDMLTFTPDGTKVLVANEAEMVEGGLNAEGSVSIIDLSGVIAGTATEPTVSTASFSAFNSQSDALKAEGVRLFAGEAGFESTTVAQDLEPEYISISPDGTTAFVTLQENNAVAILDIASGTFTDIVPLCLKSFLGLPFDGSDKDGGYHPQADLPVYGQYMPDAIASFTGADGQTYYVIANEGDDRDDFIAPDETAKVSSLNLDDTIFPDEVTLKTNSEIGPLKVSNAPGNNGDTDGDGDIDQLLSYGGRSFSILNSEGVIVFDSATHIEQFAAANGILDDGRSDAKGMEPEGITIGVVGDKTLAFVTLERGEGGIMVYDVTNPAEVSFVQYLAGNDGDQSPEGVLFVSAEDSPTGRDLLVVSNESSNTVTIYQGEADLMISEVNSNATGGDFFELYNYGNSGISLDGWKWIDSDASFNSADAVTLSGITIGAGQKLVIVNTGDADAFRTAWGISDSVPVVALGGKGLGKSDAVVLFDAEGKVVTAFNYSASAITASDGTVIAAANRADGAAISGSSHAGVAIGGSGDAVSAVWDGQSTENPAYTYAVAGELGAVAQANGVGSPGMTTAYTLQLLHFADAEAGLLASGTAPNLAALVDTFEDDYVNSITLAGGDNFIPGPFLAAGTDSSVIDELNEANGSSLSPTATVPIGAIDIAIHNAIGVEASAIGNHEFDLGSRVLKDAFASTTTGADFPYISANLDFSGDSDLRSTFVDTTATAGLEEASSLNGKIVPSAVITENGEKIGLVGATTQLLKIISSPSGTVVDDGSTGGDNMNLLAAALQPVIDDLVAQGVNKIILMSHLQVIANEKNLAGKLSGVDIILAAGSNTRLGDADDEAVAFEGHAASFADTYPLQMSDKDGNTTLIVNTDNEFTNLGRLVVDFDLNGHIIAESLADNLAVNGAYAATEENVAEAWGVTVDELATTAFAEGTRGDAVESLVTAVQEVIDVKDTNVYGYSDVYLEGERATVRSEETNLGDLSADANAYAAKLAMGQEAASSAYVVSLKNGGGIRAQIGTISAPDPVDGTVDKLPPTEGSVSQLDVENSLRFNNQLMMFDTTAEGLKAILEHGVAAGTLQGRFPQVGGVLFSWDPDAPSGSRVSDISLVGDDYHVNLYNDGALLDNVPESLSLVTLSFLANGGDGYPMKVNGSNFRYLTVESDGSYTLSVAVDESLDFTVSANLPDSASVLGEQSAFETYMEAFHATPETAYDQADTSASEDMRIQNLNEREEAVLNPDTGRAIENVTVQEDGILDYRILADVFTDADGGDTLTYTATLANGDPLPDWLHFDPSSHTIETMEAYFLNGDSSKWATDSASAITAMVTGQKTDAGNLSWAYGDPADGALTTIAETLRADYGFAIGVASTVEFSHATPAGVVSHNVNRGNTWAISHEILTETQPEVVIGAGLDSYFAKAGVAKTPNDTDSDADNNGYNDEYDAFHNGTDTAYTENVEFVERETGADGGDALAAAAASVSLADGERLFGLFGTSGGNFEYYDVEDTPGTVTITRSTDDTTPTVDEDPTMAEMANAALTVLNQDADGFFVMFEQGDIDWSNHANDYEAMIGGVYDLDLAVTEVENYVASGVNGIDWSNTLVIVTSDHSNSYMRNESVLGVGDLGEVGTDVTYASGGHTNELVTVTARGAGATYFGELAGQIYDGTEIIDNTQIYTAMMNAAENAGAEHIILMIGDGMNIEHEIAASRYLYGEDFGLSWDDWGTLSDGWTGYATTWDVTSYNNYAKLEGEANYTPETYESTIGYDAEQGGQTPYPVAMTFSGTPDNEDVGTIEIIVTATDESGASASQTFELNVDKAPVILSLDPADGSHEVTVMRDIVLTFDESVVAGDGTISLWKDAVGGTLVEEFHVAESDSITVAGNQVMIDPAAMFDYGSHYLLSVEHGSVKDQSGGSNAPALIGFDTRSAQADTAQQDIGGSITFWKTGEALDQVTVTVKPSGDSLIEFRNMQVAGDGTHTLELWKTTGGSVESIDMELVLQAGATAHWTNAAGLPAGWSCIGNTEAATGHFLIGGYGEATLGAAISAGAVKLGTLSVDPENSSDLFQLAVIDGEVGGTGISSFGITSSTHDGLFEVRDLRDGNFDLMFNRLADTTGHAVSAADALAALKLAVGMNPNSDGSSVLPFQYLAADVNQDGRVRASDALGILKMAVGLDSAPSREWLFVPESVAEETMGRTSVHWDDYFSDLSIARDTELDLIGVIKGDVNGSWSSAEAV